MAANDIKRQVLTGRY
uniref:Uncharacterized protein n=1 Tax=Arundo donax TaxID=35708 RepID=A0A0A9ATI6_ARUDO